MKNVEELIKRRKLLVEKLNQVEASDNVFLCISIENMLNVMDEELRELGVDVNHLD